VRAARLTSGIPLAPDVWGQLTHVARKLGVSAP